jgi:flagellar protein FliO/FliZ
VRLGRPLERRRGRLLVPAVTVALFLSAPSVALAETFKRDETPLPASVSGSEQAAQSGGGGGGGALVRMIVGLAIVVGVIYGVYWLLRTSAKAKARRSDGGIDVVATASLGPNRSVHLLKLGGELVLVGSAEQGVTSLRVYAPEEAAQLGLNQPQNGDSALAGARTREQASVRSRNMLEELKRRTAR